MKVSGGCDEGEKLSNEADLDVVLVGVQGWFADRVCLFIFDDVWARNNNGNSFFYICLSWPALLRAMVCE